MKRTKQTFAFPILLLTASILIVAVWVSGTRSGGADPLYPVGLTTDRGHFAFQVELADTDSERARGLMFRPTLAEDRGMIFDFFAPQPMSFWMKNTQIPLDIIFIAGPADDARVSSVAEMTVPYSLEPVFSEAPVRYVLEVPGGTAERIDLDPGDAVDLSALPAANRE